MESTKAQGTDNNSGLQEVADTVTEAVVDNPIAGRIGAVIGVATFAARWVDPVKHVLLAGWQLTERCASACVRMSADLDDAA